MSYVQHLSVVVTGFDKQVLAAAREKACCIFDKPNMVTGIVHSAVNHYGSFMVCTSGSKADRNEDIVHKDQIAQLLEYMDSLAYSKKKHDNSLQYVVVSYGDCGSRIESTNQIDKIHA